MQGLRGLTEGDGLRAQLLRGGLGSMLVKAGGMALSVLLAIMLARTLGPRGYGIYAYVFALVGLLAIPAQFGLPALIVRETARSQALADWAALRGLWRWAGIAAGGLSLLVAVAGGLLAWGFAERYTGLQLATFAWGLLLVPLIVLGKLRGAALRGLRRVVVGQLPDTVLRPGLMLLFLLVALASGMGHALSPARAMALHTLAAGLAFLTGAVLLQRAKPAECEGIAARYRHRIWAASAVPLGLVVGMQFINQQADILLLGVLTDAEQVGIYQVAVQGGTLVAFGLGVVNMVVGPQFARMHARGEAAQLQRLATVSARGALAVALPAVLLFVVFGTPLLRAVVGPDYVTGAVPLAILALGQLVNAGVGPVHLLLNMTDQERIVARGVAVFALMNVAANLLLIPPLGMNGAALATALTIILSNCFFAWQVRKRLGINSTVFGAGQSSS